MELVLTDEQEMLRSATSQFLAKTAAVDQLRTRASNGGGFDPAWWAQAAQLGWTGMLVSPDHGGGSVTDAPLVDLGIVAKEMGRVVAAGPLTVVNVVASALSSAVNAKTHQDLIDGLLDGTSVASWVGDDFGCAATTPALSAEPIRGGFRLDGVKERVEHGDHADYFLVTARSGAGLGQFIVARDAAGVTASPGYSVDSARTFATITLDNVWVDADAIVETAGEVDAVVERQFQVAVTLQCAETLGVVDRAFEMTLQWAFDRYSFGRQLASYQAIKHRFADMKADLEACHATTVAAARAVSEHADNAAELVSVAKAWVGQRATDIVQDCVQLHGGIALTTEHDLHLYLRRATVNRVTWGTPSEHRRRIADIICGPMDA